MVLPDSDRVTDPGPELSVVLCTRNGADTIGEQLDALNRQDATIDWELVVVDNGSTDATVAVVETHDMGDVPVRIIDAADRAGLSFARNVGVANVAARSIAFCDDDDVVGEGWVNAMHAALQDHHLVASAMEYDRLNSLDVLRGRARFQSDKIESLLGFPVCSGACGVTKELWNAIGGNDESMTATGEDFDFAIRANREQGVEPFFAKDAIYHLRLRRQDDRIYQQASAYGQSHVELWKKHGQGKPPHGERSRAAKDWWWITTRAPLAMAGHNKPLWMRKTGKRVGRLKASISQKTFLP